MGKKITVSKETFNLADGLYNGTITNIVFYGEDEEKALLKIKLSDGTIFLDSIKTEQLGEYPFSNLFTELDTTDADDIIDKKVRFEIKNNKSKNGMTFSNIKKIDLDI